MGLSSGLGAFVILALSGCGNSNSSTGQAGNTGATGTSSGPGKLVIISPHNKEIQTEFTALWQKSHPDTQLQWISQGGTSDDLKFVREQFAARGTEKGIGVDLFFGGGSETFTELQEAGLLARLESDYGVPEDLNGVALHGKDDTWVAAALSGFGILYNRQIAQRDKLPVPTKWEGLANPALRDRVGLADPRHSGSAHTVYEIILQTNGWEKGWKILTAMAGNARTFATSASAPLQDVQNGEAVFTTAIDFYASNAIQQAGADKLGYIEPQGQYVVTPDPIGILKNGDNAAGAREFIELVMSEEGQKLWFLPTGAENGPKNASLFRLPAVPTVYKTSLKGSTAKVDPYTQKAGFDYNEEKAAKRRRALDDLIGTVLIDNHDAVKTYWKNNPNLETAGFVPISEAEFMQVASKWTDARFANEWKEKWSQAARGKFNS